jgi:hypothetical protein
MHHLAGIKGIKGVRLNLKGVMPVTENNDARDRRAILRTGN